MNAPQPPAVVAIGPAVPANERTVQSASARAPARSPLCACSAPQQPCSRRRRDAVARRRERAAGRVRRAGEHHMADAAEEQRDRIASLGADGAAHAPGRRDRHSAQLVPPRATLARERCDAVRATGPRASSGLRAACAGASRPRAGDRAAWSRAGPIASRPCSSSAPYSRPPGRPARRRGSRGRTRAPRAHRPRPATPPRGRA